MAQSTPQVELPIPESNRQITEDETNEKKKIGKKSNLNYGWWCRIFIYIICLIGGQCAATLLGRFYYDKGGNSKWMAAFVQSSGFPILIPLFFFFKSPKKTDSSPLEKPSKFTLSMIYIAFGLLLAGDNLLYSYGMLFLPVSTFSLISASQLPFNALFSLVLNAQKFTALILNSVVVVTISAALLAVNSESETSEQFSAGKYVIGFICTVAASSAYALYLSLLELTFKKVTKSESFDTVVKMLFYPSLVASCCCVVGLYVSGEMSILTAEMNGFSKGEISYLMTLIWTAILWTIGTLGLPTVPVLAVFFFHDKMDATLLGRFYYDEGGNSKWMATFVQSSGFPVLLPLFFLFKSSKNTAFSSPEKPSGFSLFLIYLFFGLMLAGDNLMYSYGLLYLPVSTYSLICASQLAFNCLFSLLLNAQKFTALILNSVVIVTISAALLAVHSEPDTSTKLSAGKYAIGFVCTVAASATYALYLSLLELTFKRVIKSETFNTILKMQVYPSFIASCACVVGLYASGEIRHLTAEMNGFNKGEISYLMTLIWTAVLWQICCIGLLGLIFEVSSLFSNVISTLGLPALPVLAVIFFNDKMDGEKIIALLLAVWGFLSYVYQNYLDDSKAKSSKPEENEATITH
uniref:Purine permease n=1 Tax=Solanum lycopersicum TaxID=4081 RepID=A0A3Q7HU71_SOLLC